MLHDSYYHFVQFYSFVFDGGYEDEGIANEGGEDNEDEVSSPSVTLCRASYPHVCVVGLYWRCHICLDLVGGLGEIFEKQRY